MIRFLFQSLAAILISSSVTAHSDPTPLAVGLPTPAALGHQGPWKSKIQLSNGVLLKDGKPFFPIGWVFGTSEEALAQAKAMGCNAVELDFGWQLSTGPGTIPSEVFSPVVDEIRRAAKWDFAAFPLFSNHYIPTWFRQSYSTADYQPLGSDGNKTGDYFEYSIHAAPLREQLPNFWKTAAPLMAKEPNVVAAETWNEPCYGGTWNKGTQFADYSKPGMTDYRAYLQKTYSDIGKLNAAYGTTFSSWDTVEAPKSPGEFGRRAWLEWIEFGQRSLGDFFAWQRSILNEAAPSLKLSIKKQTNPWDSSAASSGNNWYLLGKSEDIFGLDIYAGSPFTSRSILTAASTYADGKPAMIFETNTLPANADARTPDMIRVQLWAPLAGGIRGMFIFALIKDSEHGILGDQAAKPEARAEYAHFIKDVSSHQRELASPRLPGRIGVIYSTTGAIQMPGDTVGRFTLGAFDMLANSDYQVDFIPEEECNAAYLHRFSLVVLPSETILRPAEIDALQTYLQGGGRMMAFGGALSRTELYAEQAPPAFLGLKQREPALGDRRDQAIGKVSSELNAFVNGEVPIKGVEIVSALVGETKNFLQGQEVKTASEGKILAYNTDSYPTILQTHQGQVVYCAFDSEYSESLRSVIEGVVHEVFGLRQEARLVNTRTDATDSAIVTGIREDYRDKKLRYLIAINTLFNPRTLAFDLPEGWKVSKELLHQNKTLQREEGKVTCALAPRDVYLFLLQKK